MASGSKRLFASQPRLPMLPGRTRYELKFLLPCAAKASFLEKIRFALQPDPHGNEKAAYRISSLYYDTRDLETFWEKMDGVLRRKKFRLRYYGEPEEVPQAAFFEIKHRYNNCISKERMRLAPSHCFELLANQADLSHLVPAEPDSASESEQALLYRVLNFHHRWPLVPTAIVSYLREAWVGVHEPDLRVTFDHELSAHEADDYLSPGTNPGTPALGSRYLVLEIKFDQRLPRWLQQRLVGEQLRPVRFSKYAESVLARRLDR